MRNRFAWIYSAAAVALAGCAAAPEAPKVAEAPKPKSECLHVSGSNLCRNPGSGAMTHVQAVSGADLRKSSAPLGGPSPTPGPGEGGN